MSTGSGAGLRGRGADRTRPTGDSVERVVNIPAALGDPVAVGVYAVLQLYLMESRRVNTRSLARSLHVSVHRVRRALHLLQSLGYLAQYHYDGVRVSCKLVTPNAEQRLYKRKSRDGHIELDFGRVSHARLSRMFLERLEAGEITVDALRLAMLLKLRDDASRWRWSQLMQTLGWSRARLYRAMRSLREAGLLSMDTRGERYLIGTPAYARAMRRRELEMQRTMIQQVRQHLESLASTSRVAPSATVSQSRDESRPRNATELVLELVRRGIDAERACELARQHGTRALEIIHDPPPR